MDELTNPKLEQERGDAGFMLLAAIVMIFMVLLVLSVAAPRIATQIRHEREVESAHRAEQYVRAIRIFYLKFHRYPASIEQLEKTNNQRFLRQRYVDPLTGKDDWRLIHVGENQTQVKNFFGEDLPGLQAGLGSAAGMASTTGSGSGAFNNGSTPGSTPGAGSAFNNGGSPGTGLGGGIGSPSASGAGGVGQTGASTGTGTGTGTTGSGSNGIASQDATTFNGSGGGQIIGVGSAKSGDSLLVVNGETTYETWEFLYDPRIEQAWYAKSTLLGGVATGGTNGASGLGSAAGMASPGVGGTPATGTTPTSNGPGTPPPTGP